MHFKTFNMLKVKVCIHNFYFLQKIACKNKTKSFFSNSSLKYNSIIYMKVKFTFSYGENLVRVSKNSQQHFELYDPINERGTSINYVRNIKITNDKKYLILNCNSTFLLIIDYKTMKSIGKLAMQSDLITDFCITDDKDLIIVSNGSKHAFVLGRSSYDIYKLISCSKILKKKSGLSMIRQVKKVSLVLFSRFKHGILVVTKYNRKTKDFKVLQKFKHFISDLTNSIASTRNGDSIFGNFTTSLRVSYQMQRKKVKTICQGLKGLNITSSTLSEKIRGLFLSGSGTMFNHFHLFSRKIVYETDLKDEKNLFYSILIKWDSELLIGTGVGSIYNYDVKKREIRRLILMEEEKNYSIFSINVDKENNLVFVGGYKNFRDYTTCLNVYDLDKILNQ